MAHYLWLLLYIIIIRNWQRRVLGLVTIKRFWIEVNLRSTLVSTDQFSLSSANGCNIK